MKPSKAQQYQVVEFELDEDNICWYITHVVSARKCYFSESNNWVTDENIKKFATLHAAINFAKKRKFILFNTPVYNCTITDSILTVFLNNKEIAQYEDITSEKQVSDLMKEKYAINLSKLSVLI